MALVRPRLTDYHNIALTQAEADFAIPFLETFYHEIGLISRKKPSELLNKFKLGFINQMLESVNRLFGTEYRPFPDFEKFDVDALPISSLDGHFP